MNFVGELSMADFAEGFMLNARPYYHHGLKGKPQYGALPTTLIADRNRIMHYIKEGIPLADVKEEVLAWLAEILPDEEIKKTIELELFKKQHL